MPAETKKKVICKPFPNVGILRLCPNIVKSISLIWMREVAAPRSKFHVQPCPVRSGEDHQLSLFSRLVTRHRNQGPIQPTFSSFCNLPHHLKKRANRTTILSSIHLRSRTSLKVTWSPYEPDLFDIFLQERTRHLIAANLWIPNWNGREIFFLFFLVHCALCLQR